MEAPYPGRAILTETFDGIEIIIPAKKNPFIILFLFVWLSGWFFGEVFAIGNVFGIIKGNQEARLFMILWLTMWTIGGFIVIRVLLWFLIGKEIISAGHGVLSLSKKGAIFSKLKTYDLREAKRFRIQQSQLNFGNSLLQRKSLLIDMFSGGTVAFDYGLRSVNFAGGIDEAEANVILKKLRDKKILTESNFQ